MQSLDRVWKRRPFRYRGAYGFDLGFGRRIKRQGLRQTEVGLLEKSGVFEIRLGGTQRDFDVIKLFDGQIPIILETTGVGKAGDEGFELFVDSSCALWLSNGSVKSQWSLTFPIDKCAKTVKGQELEVAQFGGGFWPDFHVHDHRFKITGFLQSNLISGSGWMSIESYPRKNGG